MKPREHDYIAASRVAQVVGIEFMTLDFKYRPDAWGSPKDFGPLPWGGFGYALGSLPELADALEQAGKQVAAEKLRTFVAEQQAARAAAKTVDAAHAVALAAGPDLSKRWDLKEANA